MRRVLLTFLLVLLPLQFVWASVAAYCQHERGNAVNHIGHHVHDHDASSTSESGSQPFGSLAADPDCAACHGGSVSATVTPMLVTDLPTGPIVALGIPEARPPLRSDRPERPQWPAAV